MPLECCYDPRVDVCLLFMSGEGLSSQDIKLVQGLAGLVPVVPVIAKVWQPGSGAAQDVLSIRAFTVAACRAAVCWPPHLVGRGQAPPCCVGEGLHLR